MKLWVKKTLGQWPMLVPVDSASEELFAKIPFGKDVEIEVKQPRNPMFHRLVFALVAKIAAGIGEEDTELVRDRLKIHIGEFDVIAVERPVTEKQIEAVAHRFCARWQIPRREACQEAKAGLEQAGFGIREILRPRSWAFHKMDEISFKAMFEKLVKAAYAIWGMLPADIRREIDKMLAPDLRR